MSQAPAMSIDSSHQQTQRAAAGLSRSSCCSCGWVQVGTVHSTRYGDDDHKTLKQLQFQVGSTFGGGAFCPNCYILQIVFCRFGGVQSFADEP